MARLETELIIPFGRSLEQKALSHFHSELGFALTESLPPALAFPTESESKISTFLASVIQHPLMLFSPSQLCVFKRPCAGLVPDQNSPHILSRSALVLVLRSTPSLPSYGTLSAFAFTMDSELMRAT